MPKPSGLIGRRGRVRAQELIGYSQKPHRLAWMIGNTEWLPCVVTKRVANDKLEIKVVVPTPALGIHRAHTSFFTFQVPPDLLQVIVGHRNDGNQRYIPLQEFREK